MSPEPIAVVGIGGLFPGAGSPAGYWESVAQGRCAAREVPPGRWLLSPSEAFDPFRGAPDKVYSTRGCFVEDFTFDPEGLDADPGLLSRLDPVFHFALHAGRQAWRDAKTGSLDRRRVGVILGNIALPTDAFSAFSRKVLAEKFVPLIPEPRQIPLEFVGVPVHPFNRFPAGLPAGLLARALGLGGGAYTLDAACASSLYALSLACDSLASGKTDAMLTGGVSRPECLYTQMGFSQLRALSPSGRPAPLDASGDGLVVGEGAGVFVLKRLSDALAHGDSIYGVLRGIGLSNDIGGSLLAPDGDGQLRAMRSAYHRAGWAPFDVDFIECHAAGTPVGDAVEIQSLRSLWGESGWTPRQCALGSAKANVGHMLTAAGAAGLMRVLLSLREKAIPPHANYSMPVGGLDLDATPFRVPTAREPWAPRAQGVPRRAAVSSFGFGGINAHVLLEEWIKPSPRSKRPPAPPAPKAAAVAIVGMDARFGSLGGLREFQEAALGSVPSEGRLPRELSIPAQAYRIPPKELEEMLPQQALMLRSADAALRDAALLEAGSSGRAVPIIGHGTAPLPEPPARARERTGVFIGMELDPNTANFHFRWSLPESERARGGPPLTANRTMGALGGVIASRIAREFRIGGPSFTIASDETAGLRALEAAADAVGRGELDCALVGAVDIGGDPRAVRAEEELGRAVPIIGRGTAPLPGPPGRVDPTGAVRPFDPSSLGGASGEGAVCLVLKRLEDALKAGERVYAVLKGVGAASGGPVGAAPSADCIGLALERAYEAAGTDPARVGFLETHGSGVPGEDAAESSALVRFFGNGGPREHPAALGSLAPVIGRAGAASGLASLAKAALALYQQILPALDLKEPRPELAAGRSLFHSPRVPQFWLRNRADGPRLAGVTSIGLGGNCVHAVLAEADSPPPLCERPLERRAPLGARKEGLFVIEEDSAPGLVAASRRLRSWMLDRPEKGVEALARAWWAQSAGQSRRPLAVAFVARDKGELQKLCLSAEKSLIDDPASPISGLDRIFYSPLPVGRRGRVAFVFPGSGNQYLGMGLGVGASWPEVLRAQDAENGRLLDQSVPHLFAPWLLGTAPGWEEKAIERLAQDHKAMIFGQVSHGTVLSDLVRSFGVQPDAVIGYSLGETAGLFSLRVWRDRDEMLRRMHASTLFVSDLAGPCDAARRSWGLAAHEAVDWALGVVDRPEKLVRAAVSGMEKVFVLIVNTPKECVVGGARHAVRKMVSELGGTFLPLQGVTTVHCSVAKEVEAAYRDLHRLPTHDPGAVQFYSGAWARPYPVDRESAADAITAQAVGGIDFPAVVERAYDDGVRVFIELGPRNSCTRMISKILGERPHMARSACVRDQDDVSTLLRLLGHLSAERAAVDLGALYGGESRAAGHRPPEPEGPTVRIPLDHPLFRLPEPLPAEPAPPVPSSKRAPVPAPRAAPKTSETPIPRGIPRPPAPVARAPESAVPAPLMEDSPLRALVSARQAASNAHAQFLKLADFSTQAQLRILGLPTATASEAISAGLRPPAGAAPSQSSDAARRPFRDRQRATPEPAVPSGGAFMDRSQCLEFAVGRIGTVLGPAFAPVDAHPTRVRLPGEPLMLVDRILSVEGEPRSMGSGRVVTEHDILPGAWYLDAGRIPTCIAVEAGQADLFLSGYLGIDSHTRGLAMYRLLDAEVTFHQGLPGPGRSIRYDIRIERFARQGDTHLFFFSFEGTVDGRPLLSMRKGCAGFFTQEQLAAGKGIVFTELDRRPLHGKRPADWTPPAPMRVESLDERQVEALREGRLAEAFGGAFAGLKLSSPMRLPGAGGGRMRLVDRVETLDPAGGRWGLGLIRAEADIHPEDWFLTCHFIDDQVMPGTLMYECCMHTLRIFLMRMGWVGSEEECSFEPLPGAASGLKCRGQVLPSTKKVAYELSIKEIGYGPEPYAKADALMYADGHPIVLITDMSVRLRGTDERRLKSLWDRQGSARRVPLFDTDRILAFAVGKPSEAFGEPYKVFDSERVIARLPGPPYQFLDRITEIRGAKPFVLEAGAEVVAEYDVPPDAWYFRANRQKSMPFAVLLETALQPCGWLAAYLGSALRSESDLSFRNLGGKAVLHEEVFPDAGTLTTRVKMTRVSQSAGMIIQNYDLEVRRGPRLVYQGDTYFGFFSKEALADQKGILSASPYSPSAQERARGVELEVPACAPLDPEDPASPDTEKLALPARAFRMLDSIPLFIPDGGPARLGFLRGIKKVDPAEWFFKAHFFQDPVCPGSLGLESFQQLLKAFARQRWAAECPEEARWTPMVPGERHEWVYRGQVIPRNKVVTVEAVVTEVDDRQKRLKADGFLSVDGLLIYQMKGFSLAAPSQLSDAARRPFRDRQGEP